MELGLCILGRMAVGACVLALFIGFLYILDWLDKRYPAKVSMEAPEWCTWALIVVVTLWLTYGIGGAILGRYR